MTNLGVSMRREVLEHKKRDGDRRRNVFCYWTMPNGVPPNPEIRNGSKLWVASEGRWRGYFVLIDAGDSDLEFWSESWVEQDGGPRSPFQGFTYKVPA